MKNKSREKRLLYLAATQLGVLNQNLYSAHSKQTKEITSRKHANKLGSFWHWNLWKSEVYNSSKCKWINSWKKKRIQRCQVWPQRPLHGGLVYAPRKLSANTAALGHQCRQLMETEQWKITTCELPKCGCFSFLILTFFQSSDNEKCQNNGCVLPLFLLGD